MEQRVFEKHLRKCTHVCEATTYLEILSYDGGNSKAFKGPLSDAQLTRFFRAEGEFNPSSRLSQAQPSSSLRFLLQIGAEDPEIFTPSTLSLHPNHFESMLRDMRLPLQAVELTSIVGPLFWHRYTMPDGNDPHLQIICGKHDMRKEDKTRGWQLVLSYSFKRRQVTAFVKGTPTSIISDGIDDLENGANEASHPLLFPVIILSHLISMKTELDQRVPHFDQTTGTSHQCR